MRERRPRAHPAGAAGAVLRPDTASEAAPSIGVLRTVERVAVSIDLDPWLGLPALAKYAGLSVRTLRDCLYDSARPLPHYRIGGKLLVRRSDFDAWMATFRRVGRAAEVDAIVAEVLSRVR